MNDKEKKQHDDLLARAEAACRAEWSLPGLGREVAEALAAAAPDRLPGSVTYVSNVYRDDDLFVRCLQLSNDNKAHKAEIIEHLALIGRLSEPISELETENTRLALGSLGAPLPKPVASPLPAAPSSATKPPLPAQALRGGDGSPK